MTNISEEGMDILLAHLANLPRVGKSTYHFPIYYPNDPQDPGAKHSHGLFLQEFCGVYHPEEPPYHQHHNVAGWLERIGIKDDPENGYHDLRDLKALFKTIFDHSGTLPEKVAASPFYYGYKRMQERTGESETQGIEKALLQAAKFFKEHFDEGGGALDRDGVQRILKSACERLLGNGSSKCQALNVAFAEGDREEIERLFTLASEAGY